MSAAAAAAAPAAPPATAPAAAPRRKKTPPPPRARSPPPCAADVDAAAALVTEAEIDEILERSARKKGRGAPLDPEVRAAVRRRIAESRVKRAARMSYTCPACSATLARASTLVTHAERCCPDILDAREVRRAAEARDAEALARVLQRAELAEKKLRRRALEITFLAAAGTISTMGVTPPGSPSHAAAAAAAAAGENGAAAAAQPSVAAAAAADTVDEDEEEDMDVDAGVAAAADAAAAAASEAAAFSAMIAAANEAAAAIVDSAEAGAAADAAAAAAADAPSAAASAGGGAAAANGAAPAAATASRRRPPPPASTAALGSKRQRVQEAPADIARALGVPLERAERLLKRAMRSIPLAQDADEPLQVCVADGQWGAGGRKTPAACT